MYDLQKIEWLINGCKWNWARTYLSVPHEYIVRRKCNLTESEFLYIVHAQRDMGIPERWGRYNFPYLHVNGYKYWTMGDTFENTIIINRQKEFYEFDQLENPVMECPDEELYQKAVRWIVTLGKPVFEMGCGIGRLTKELFISPKSYYACEPCGKLVTMFRERNKGFYKNITRKSFEEAVEKWIGGSYAIISLFGSASYVMEPYLSMIAEKKIPHFLMFYAKGYCPEQFKEMHHFDRSGIVLRKLFPNSFHYPVGNYHIVSSHKME